MVMMRKTNTLKFIGNFEGILKWDSANSATYRKEFCKF